MEAIIRTFAHAVLAVSAAGAVYCAGALVIHAAGARLSSQARELCWRLLALKVVAVAIMVIAIAGG
jgi:hypothetical protein